jgi:FHS family L-fucose permease-like MFS transporter
LIIDSDVSSSTDPSPGVDPNAPTVNAPDLQIFVFALFFIFGGITSLNDVLIPMLKKLFSLSSFEAMLVQFAFFTAYFIISLPAAAIVKRLGYMKTATIGLLTMTGGCLLFVPATGMGLLDAILVALFVVAAGITIVQVVANPLISILGPPKTAHSRLTFAQFFNSAGTTIFPFVGAKLILGNLSNMDPHTLTGSALKAFHAAGTHVVGLTYLGLAVALAIVAAVVWSRRRQLPEAAPDHSAMFSGFDLFKRPRFGLGSLCIFLYVGAEVAIASLIVNYLEQTSVMGLDPESAGKHVSWYWGGAMIGRAIGAWLLRLASPGKILAGAASLAILMLVISANTTGLVSGYSLLAIGLFNSIMFPTIFTLASEGLGLRTADGSGIICMAIVGGAIIPPLTGLTDDVTHSWRIALAIPAVCYAAIVAYGVYTRRAAILSGTPVSAH